MYDLFVKYCKLRQPSWPMPEIFNAHKTVLKNFLSDSSYYDETFQQDIYKTLTSLLIERMGDEEWGGVTFDRDGEGWVGTVGGHVDNYHTVTVPTLFEAVLGLWFKLHAPAAPSLRPDWLHISSDSDYDIYQEIIIDNNNGEIVFYSCYYGAIYDKFNPRIITHSNVQGEALNELKHSDWALKVCQLLKE